MNYKNLSKISDSTVKKPTGSRVCDSVKKHKEMYQRVKDALEDTESTEDAVSSLVDICAEGADPVEVLQATTEFFGALVDRLEEGSDDWEDDGAEDVEPDGDADDLEPEEPVEDSTDPDSDPDGDGDTEDDDPEPVDDSANEGAEKDRDLMSLDYIKRRGFPQWFSSKEFWNKAVAKAAKESPEKGKVSHKLILQYYLDQLKGKNID